LEIEIKCIKTYPEITFSQQLKIPPSEIANQWEVNKSLIKLGKFLSVIIADETIEWIINIIESISTN